MEAINITVVGLDFVTMMEVIEECENLTRVNETLSTRVDEEIADEEIGYWSLLRGIVPGMVCDDTEGPV